MPAAAIPLALLLIPRMPAGRATRPAPASPGPGHHLASIGRVGEWGPASPSRVHRARLWSRERRAGVGGLLRGGLGWMLAAWLPAYAGSAIIFSLYPVLFRNAFGIATATSALAFAVIVFVSLPLFVLAGRVSQRFGPAPSSRPPTPGASSCSPRWPCSPPPAHVPAVLPLAAFAGIMFAWSFLSVASPGLAGQLRPDAEGDAQGLLNASSGLAGLLGSVTGGVAADLWGYPAALGIGAGATAAGLAIFAVTLLRRRPAPAGAVPG